MTIIGALIISGGALFGIWLGAVYAASRISGQLEVQDGWEQSRREDEATRFEKQLDAEAERLERQLNHDRRMRDVEELRVILDKAAGALRVSSDATIKTAGRTPVIGYEPESIESHRERMEGRRIEALEESRLQVFALASGMGPLQLRFGLHHPVPEAYWQARERHIEFQQAVDVLQDKWTQEQRELVDERLRAAGAAYGDFIGACRYYTGIADAVPADDENQNDQQPSDSP